MSFLFALMSQTLHSMTGKNKGLLIRREIRLNVINQSRWSWTRTLKSCSLLFATSGQISYTHNSYWVLTFGSGGRRSPDHPWLLDKSSGTQWRCVNSSIKMRLAAPALCEQQRCDWLQWTSVRIQWDGWSESSILPLDLLLSKMSLLQSKITMEIKSLFSVSSLSSSMTSISHLFVSLNWTARWFSCSFCLL